jgi:hypothetical protein
MAQEEKREWVESILYHKAASRLHEERDMRMRQLLAEILMLRLLKNDDKELEKEL